MSSLFAIPIHSAVYREEQRFGWWLYALVAILLGLGWAFLVMRHDGPEQGGQIDDGRFEFSMGVTLGIVIPGALVIGVLRMTTEVRPTHINIWFGWVPTYRREFSVAAIRSVEVIRFRPIIEHRGWGIRTGPGGERVLSARGDQGVRLTFEDGTRLVIGSQRPEPLAAAIDELLLKRAA